MIDVQPAAGKSQESSFVTDDLKLSVYIPSDAGKIIKT